MGYRNYIGFLPRKKYNKIKSLTIPEIFDYYEWKPKYEGDEPYLGVYDFGERLYEFGAYVDFKPPKGSLKTFFKKKDVESNWNEDGELKVVTKEFLAYIINTYRERVKKYYNDMYTPFFHDEDNKPNFLNSVKLDYGEHEKKYKFDFSTITDNEQTALFKILDHIRTMRSEWVHLTPFDLVDGNEITTSWKYEYGIFELVRIYKSFDWKKNIMIYYGY